MTTRVWHMGRHDFVSVVVRLERLQPFYLMPVFFATKLILTLLIFGFTLSFNEIPPEAGACKKHAKWLVQQIAGLGMIAMASHGYYVDGRRYFLHASNWSCRHRDALLRFSS